MDRTDSWRALGRQHLFWWEGSGKEAPLFVEAPLGGLLFGDPEGSGEKGSGDG
jgi:hypothetical protein